MTALLCSAALPTTATTMTPMKTLVMPKAAAASCTEPTRISLIQAIRTVAPASVSSARFRLQAPAGCGSACSLAGEELFVGAQREEQVEPVGNQEDDGDAAG